MEASAAPRLQWDARLWGVLLLVCGVVFVDALDVSLIGIALPSIREDLGLSTAQLQWIVSGYVLGYGGLLLLGGRAADLLGRRRVFLAALAVFALASVLGGLASDGAVLVATRFVKGMSAAFTVPASLSIVTTTFAEGPSRNRALSLHAACGASGFSLGLVCGGLLTELDWRWTFLMPGPITLLVLALGTRLIPRDRVQPAWRRGFDLGGAVSITAGMLLLVRTVVRVPDAGWASGATLGGLAAALALLAGFVAIERRAARPLVRLGILRSGSLVRANVGSMALLGCYLGFQFVGTLYMQTLLGWSPLETALAFLPAGLLVAFGSPHVGRLANRFGTQRIVAIGLATVAAGYALFLRIDAAPSYATLVLPTMLLVGTGCALCFPSLMIQATAGVADHEQGLAAALVSTSSQVGGVLVLAVVSAVVSARTGAASDAASLLAGFRLAVVAVTVVAAAAALVAVVGVGRRREPALAYAET